MASVKQYGLAGIGSDVQLGKNGGRLKFNTVSGQFELFASDGTTLEELLANGIQLGTSVAITEILDDATFANVSASGLATSNSTKAYIDQVTNNGGMLVATDSGSPSSGSIIFASETFELTGNANNIITSWEGTNTVRIGLTENIKVFGNVEVVGEYTGNANLNIVEFNSLSGTGTITVTDIIDDDTMATATNTTIATSESIKNYIDNELTSGGLAMNTAGDSGNGQIVFSTETYNVFGTANQVTTLFDGAATLTISLPNDLTAPGNLTVTSDFTTSLTQNSVPFIGASGLLTENANLTFNSATETLSATVVTFGSLSDGAITVTDFESTLTSGAAIIPTSAAVKTYVDAEIDKVDQLIINGDASTQGNVNWYANQELSILGTINEIETNMTNQTLQIGLPNDVSINNNLTVVGNLLSNDITSTSISIDGDATVTGNLTVQGSTTVVNSTEVDIADATIRVNSDGTVVSSGLEANINGVIESILYVPGTDQWTFSNTILADIEFTSLSGTGAITVTDILDQDDLVSDSNTALATQQSIKAYVDAQINTTEGSANIDLLADSGSGSINVFNEQFRILGGLNINTAVTDGAGGNVVTVNLDDSVSTGNVTATGTLSFGTLTDGTDNITTIENLADTMTSDDNALATSAAIIDYVGNNAGDGLLIRNTFTADSTNSNVSIGTVPNITARTYYANKVVITIQTAFSGGSVNQLVIKDNDGAGTTLVAAEDNDISTTGTYVVEQDTLNALTKNQPVRLYFYESNGSTEAVPTGGAVTVAVFYNYTL